MHSTFPWDKARWVKLLSFCAYRCLLLNRTKLTCPTNVFPLKTFGKERLSLNDSCSKSPKTIHLTRVCTHLLVSWRVLCIPSKTTCLSSGFRKFQLRNSACKSICSVKLCGAWVTGTVPQSGRSKITKSHWSVGEMHTFRWRGTRIIAKSPGSCNNPKSFKFQVQVGGSCTQRCDLLSKWKCYLSSYCPRVFNVTATSSSRTMIRRSWFML
jgi:hypothetical protein